MDIKTFFSNIVNVFKNEVDTEVKHYNDWKQKQAQAKAPQQPRPVFVHSERTDEECVAYFREILATEFSQYEVRENVPVQSLVGDAADEFKLYDGRPLQAYKAEWGQPYTFVLFQNGLVYGVVMLGRGHTHDNKVTYLISRMYAKKMNVPYINFYNHMPNERGYVVNRIREMMHLV